MKIYTKVIKTTFFLLCLTSLVSCGFYSFTGADIGDAKTFQVNFFRNDADLVEPGIDNIFTIQLQDFIQNQTSLGLTNSGGDLLFDGEIIEYYISPMTATSSNTAAQNRLTISVNVRFYNNKNPEKDFEKKFSFYYDYPANAQLIGSELETAVNEIFERLIQDIFNQALTDW